MIAKTLHCKKCGKQRRPNVFIESKPDKDGKIERLHVNMKRIQELMAAKGLIKFFQRGVFNSLCDSCHTVTQYKVNESGKIVVI